LKIGTFFINFAALQGNRARNSRLRLRLRQAKTKDTMRTTARDAHSFTNSLVLCLAQGLFVGRLPLTPGTFGSALGLLWVALLLAAHNAWLYAAGTLLGITASVWFCGQAERILSQTDPGSVVLDEIAAMPVCFTAWLALRTSQDGQMPGPLSLFSERAAWWTAAIFVAFRFFDIAKPWPVRQSQSLPGGWGVTIDDVLAAVYVNLCIILAWGASQIFPFGIL
jgi:phosphatidylglycerophosphatase A